MSDGFAPVSRSLVLISMGQNSTTREDCIYVIGVDGLPLVKLRHFDPGRQIVRITSDNPAYDPLDKINGDELRGFGRAIWLARNL